MVNKKIALMIGLLFTTAAVQAEKAVVHHTAAYEADYTEFAKFDSLSKLQQLQVRSIATVLFGYQDIPSTIQWIESLANTLKAK